MPTAATPAPVEASQVPPTAKGRTVFLTGATGYIGGTVLQKLLSLPTPPSLITTLVRDPKKAELIQKLDVAGVKMQPIVGSLEDLDKLRQAAEEHDVVISTANCDDLNGVSAMLDGMKRRKVKTGQMSLLIHTSGTGSLVDNAKGMYAGDIVSCLGWIMLIFVDIYRFGLTTEDGPLSAAALHRRTP